MSERLRDVHGLLRDCEAEIATLRQERNAEHARAVVAENYKSASLLSKSSWQEVVEDKLRTELAETQIKLEAAEAEHARLRETISSVVARIDVWMTDEDDDAIALLLNIKTTLAPPAETDHE